MMSNQAGLGLGDKVHTEEINEYPEDLKQEYLNLSTWVKAFTRYYGRNVTVRVIDPQSLMGIWRVIRHRIRRYPTILLENGEKFSGWEAETAFHNHLQRLLKTRGLPVPEGAFSLIPQISLPG